MAQAQPAQPNVLPPRLLYHKHITGGRRPLDLSLREVWRYRDLVLLFTRRDFVVQFKQTILGPLWIFLTPVITSLMYAFVFGNVAGISTDGVPKVLFYLASTAAWTFFAACVNGCAETFTSNAQVMSKVYFPRLVVPLSIMLSAACRFLLQMIPVLGFFAYHLVRGEVSTSPAWWLLVPVCLLHLGLLGLGCGIIVSALTTKYRDLSVLVKFGVSLWMYASPVVYPLSALPAAARTIVLLNPATVPIELLRQALWQHATVTPGAIILSWAITLVVVLVGITLFNRVERVFADTV